MPTAQPFNVSTDADDDLVFVEFAPASQVEGHGFPVEIGPQFDAHADAWLDALNLHAPSGYRSDAALTVDAQVARLDAMLRDWQAEKLARPAGTIAPEQALADIVAALPAPAPIPTLPVAFALRRAAFGPVSA